MMRAVTCMMLVCLAARADAGLVSLGGHVDLRWNYEKTSRQWTCQGVYAGAGGVDEVWAAKDFFLPLGDKPYRATMPTQSGARVVQPSSAAYAFTGVAAGMPLWLAVQGTAGTGEAWPGFDNTQGAGTFGEYLEADARLTQPQTLARPWIQVMLKDVFYQGMGATPFFSMFTGSGSSLRVWMASSNGIAGDDSFLYAAGSHAHMNWGFGSMGIYRIRLAVSAYEGPGQTNPTGESGVFSITFAVGPEADWQARNFSALELEDPAVSGMEADPDGDGMVNRLEYAFGMDPRRGGSQGVSAGLSLPVSSLVVEASGIRMVMEYPRRRLLELSRPPSYAVEFSDDLAVGSWGTAGDATETVMDFQGTEAGLNAVWQKVRVERFVPASRKICFSRVRVKWD
jgi:surface-anchored protein